MIIIFEVPVNCTCHGGLIISWNDNAKSYAMSKLQRTNSTLWVHTIPTHPIAGKSTNKARPIIAKVSFFKDKELIKSHIKKIAERKKIWCS